MAERSRDRIVQIGSMLLLAPLLLAATQPVAGVETIRSDVSCRAAASDAAGVTYEGWIAGNGACDYKLALRKGQSLAADLDAGPAFSAHVAAPERHDLASGQRFTAPASGTYTIRVAQTRLYQRANDPAVPFKLRLRIR